MAKEDKFEVEGVVTKVIKGGTFEVTVKVGGSEKVVTCRPSGKLRMNMIKILLNDSVTIEVSPYDFNRGIITWRNK